MRPRHILALSIPVKVRPMTPILLVKALMRIWMPIPFEGSEVEPSATRAVQASQEFPLNSEDELKALQRGPLSHWFTSYSQAACKKTRAAAQRWDSSWGVYFFFSGFSEMPGVALARKDQPWKESLYWAQSSSTRFLI